MFDETTEICLLYDRYGELLTAKQKLAVELYFEENLSLAEIAEEFGISRQAVHANLKQAEKKLREYEAKLGILKKDLGERDGV